MTHIPFNRPRLAGREQEYIAEALERGHLSVDGPFGRRCERLLEELTGARRALLTHSATGALEMTTLLLDLEPGDEVVMPSFTFVTTASAFVVRGAVPVFVDVREDTLNLDERLVEAALTDRTRAIVAVHYAGVPCEMDVLREIASRRELALVEDAAQALGSTFRGRPAGSLGGLAALSFHETKNVTSGEGGALLLSGDQLVERAIVIRDKGTNRDRFFRGLVDKYTWVDVGSSYGLSELNAAFLWGQLEHVAEVTRDRLWTWERYHSAFEELELAGALRRPVVPAHVRHNAHLYYLLLPSLEARTALIDELATRNINAVFHYVPLHGSRAGRRYCRAHGSLATTESVADRLVRLPLWAGMPEPDVERVIEAVCEVAGGVQRVRGSASQ